MSCEAFNFLIAAVLPFSAAYVPIVFAFCDIELSAAHNDYWKLLSPPTGSPLMLADSPASSGVERLLLVTGFK